MSSFRGVFSSSVGTKLLVGLTGLLLFAYLLLHLAGNLLVFAGQETFNEYSHMLISNPLVVPAEIGLLGVFLLHVYKTVAMWLRFCSVSARIPIWLDAVSRRPRRRVRSRRAARGRGAV